MCGTPSTCRTRCPRCRCRAVCWNGCGRQANAAQPSVATLRVSCFGRPASGGSCTACCCHPRAARPRRWPDCCRVWSLDGLMSSGDVRALPAQNAALRPLVAIHDRLGALVLHGAGVAAITRMLADLIGRRVVLLDELLQVVCSSAVDGQNLGWAPREGYVRAVLATLARERRPLRVPPMADFGVAASCVLAPVAAGDAIFGYLAILTEGDEGGREDVDLQIVQHAATVYALSMMRERMAAEVARQLKDDVFEGLLLGRTQDEQVARERALRLGYKPEVSYRVVVLVARARDDEPNSPETSAQRRRLLEPLAEWCTRR